MIDGPDDTLAARLTSPSPGAIAVIGLSGPRTRPILERALRTAAGRDASTITPQRPTLCRIRDELGDIDDAIVLLVEQNGHSHAELSTHGGPRIVQRVLALLEHLGARIVAPDDFPDLLRASDAIQRQIDAALLCAGSRRMATWLLAQRDVLPAWLARAAHSGDAMQPAFIERARAAARLVRGLRLAIVGPPNAGKSTLANTLIGHDRIITSDTPGTTRDWISETALIDGWPVTLIDTAGVRQTDCDIEAEAIRRGREQSRQADLAIILLDATADAATQAQTLRQIQDELPDSLPVLAARNKCDHPTANRPQIAGARIHDISALTGNGIPALERAVTAALGLNLLENDLPAMFMSPVAERSA